MKSNTPEISTLRQCIDVLSAQVDQAEAPFDVPLIQQLVRNIMLEISDPKKPFPDDVFQPGISDTLMRAAINGMVMQVVNAVVYAARRAKP